MKHLLLIPILSLAFAAPAQANTTLIPPPGAVKPYQKWVDASRVPTPPQTIAMTFDVRGLCHAGVGGCANQRGIMALRWDARKDSMFHELGHFFDWRYLDANWRSRFATIVGRPNQPWVAWDGLMEVFADVYDHCAEGRGFQYLDQARWGNIDTGLYLSRPQIEASCRMIWAVSGRGANKLPPSSNSRQ